MTVVHGHAARLLIAAAVSAVAAMPAFSAPVSCNTGKGKVLASIKSKSTTSQTYVAVPEASIDFTQQKMGCVLVQFYAEYDAAGTMVVQALLDGATAAVPAQVYFGSQVTNYNSHAMAFVFPSVAAGAHTLNIQYKSGEGLVTNIGNHTTIVSYTP